MQANKIIGHLRNLSRNLLVTQTIIVLVILYPNQKMIYRESQEGLKILKEADFKSFNYAVEKQISNTITNDNVYQEQKKKMDSIFNNSIQFYPTILFNNQYVSKKENLSTIKKKLVNNPVISVKYILPRNIGNLKSKIIKKHGGKVKIDNLSLYLINNPPSTISKFKDKNTCLSEFCSSTNVEDVKLNFQGEDLSSISNVSYWYFISSANGNSKSIPYIEHEKVKISVEKRDIDLSNIKLNELQRFDEETPININTIPKICSEVDQFDIEHAIWFCEEYSKNSTTTINFLGISLNRNLVSVLGPILIIYLIVQISLYIYQLKLILKNNTNENIEEPWYPLFNFKFSLGWAIIILCFSPTALSAVPLWKSEIFPYSELLSWILFVLILIFSIVNWKILSEIREKIIQIQKKEE